MKIHLPAETWAEVFAWLNRRQFARKMEQLWDREFSPIAEKWLHEWSKGIKIGELGYRKAYDANQAVLCKYEKGTHSFLPLEERVPIAEVDMPKNICSFELIQISYLDNMVLAFLHKIRPLLRNVHLSLRSWHGNECIKIALDHLLPIFSDSEFGSVRLKYNEIPLLNDSRYSAALLNTKVLILCCFYSFHWCFELLANWLFSNKRADGQPRMLVFPYHGNYCNDFVTILQKRFMAATTTDGTDASFPFVVRFYRHSNFNGGRIFENIVNNGQQLIMREGMAAEDDNLLLISCPLDVDRDHLAAEWGQKVADPGTTFSVPSERAFELLFPELGPIDPICPKQQQQSHSGSSEEEANASEQPGTSSGKTVLLKRNAQNEQAKIEEEEEEVNCSGDKKKEKRARLS